jgi:hypothetical protein
MAEASTASIHQRCQESSKHQPHRDTKGRAAHRRRSHSALHEIEKFDTAPRIQVNIPARSMRHNSPVAQTYRTKSAALTRRQITPPHQSCIPELILYNDKQPTTNNQSTE